MGLRDHGVNGVKFRQPHRALLANRNWQKTPNPAKKSPPALMQTG